MEQLIKSNESRTDTTTDNKSVNASYGSISGDYLLDNDTKDDKINNLQALMNLLKGYIGTGILAIPAAFRLGGLWIGLAGIFIVGIISTYCVHMLVACSRIVEKRSGKKGLDYGKLTEEIFHIGPSSCHYYARTARIIVNSFLAVTQFGFCTVYIIFMSTNSQKVIEGYIKISWQIQVYQFFIVLLLVPYLAVTNLRILSFFSGIANVLIVLGLAVIFYTCFIDLPPVSARPAFGSWSSLPLYFGIVVFTFEGIGVVIPVETKMKSPKEFTSWFGVVNLGLTITICLVAGIGFFGYLKYGEEIVDSITLYLPNTIFYDVVRLGFVLAIFFTYGIQFYVPIEFLWSDIKAKLQTKGFIYKYGEYFLRLFFLLFTFMLAAIVPHLDLMISLVGALASTTVALILPCFLEIICLYQDGYGRLRWKLVKNIFLILFGFLGFIAGTATTLYKIVMAFQGATP